MTSPGNEQGTVAKHAPNTPNTPAIWLAIAGFFIVLGLVSAGVLRVLGRFQSAHPEVPQPIVVPATDRPISPWDDPPGDLARNLRLQQTRLNSYRWIDKKHGIVQIPIDQAMQLAAKRGWERVITELYDTDFAENSDGGRTGSR